MSWWLLSLVASAQEHALICPPDPITAVMQTAAEVERGYLHLDKAAYDDARVRLQAFSSCIDAPLPHDAVIQLHRAHALMSYVDEDLEASKRSVVALYTLQPDWTISEDLLPREHPLWSVIQDAADEVPREVAMTTRPGVTWSVDGVLFPRPEDVDEHGDPVGTYGLPGHRAFVLQVYDAEGGLIYTGYHHSALNVPVDALEVGRDPWIARQRRRKAMRWTTSVLGGGAVVASAVLLGLSMDARADWSRGAVAVGELADTQARANRQAQVGAGVGAGGVVLLTLGWSIPW